ncbi:MAG: MlaE family lipid ABC transporter permease subunit [Myxococcota bacterium]|nr:MlaE family lipid ABC transporter permease subunit [Myxococcota bacterium]
MSPGPLTTVERGGRAAVIRLHGDLVVATSQNLHAQLRAVGKRRDVKSVTLDFAGAGRVDSSGIAAISLLRRRLRKAGKKLEMKGLADHHKLALELMPAPEDHPPDAAEVVGGLELLGAGMLGAATGARELIGLIWETLRQTFLVLIGRKKLPAGSLATQISAMGVDGIFIVALLTFLLGMTMAFQGAVQLEQFGAGVFVADMIGMSMVRELAPLMTAVILTGRTGAAIAAELGTMRVRSEIDALSTMGVNPVRFLIVPRIIAITLVVPALSLMGMFVGMFGGMVVAWFALDLSFVTFWQRMVERVALLDFLQGLGKSLVFAWIIGFAGSHLGMRARGDASSVGSATTRTVVTSIFFIILVDAVFATVATLLRYG